MYFTKGFIKISIIFMYIICLASGICSASCPEGTYTPYNNNSSNNSLSFSCYECD